MRSTVRSFLLVLGATFATGVMAQADCLGILNGPNWPGTECAINGVVGTWSADCVCVPDSNFFQYDCNGVFNGPDMPGTACDDGDANTTDDTWSANCTCVGNPLGNVYDCLGILNGQNLPGTYCNNFFGDTGVWSMNCVCETNNLNYDCLGALNGTALPGTFCVWNNQQGTWSADCVCTPDSGNVFDCLGELNGPNMPGTVCDDGDSLTVQDYWDVNCACIGFQANNYDCLGVLGGSAIPGSTCAEINGDSTAFVGIWDYFCVCRPDSNNIQYDCLGNLGGTALPGTPCTIPGTILDGIWSNSCVCEPNNLPCQADFWVLQAYGADSLPVPYELWVWNLSSGGSGIFTYSWDFGDNTSSTDPYPTHTYSGNGPYVLCLTIADNANCTSVHCDSISIDPNGIYGGVLGGEGDRTDGFTINVQNPSAITNVSELDANQDIVAWPNPTEGELNIAMTNNLSGTVDVTITDLNGRVVLNETRRLINGKNQLRLSTENLGAGMYMVRIGNGTENVSVRFVKAN